MDILLLVLVLSLMGFALIYQIGKFVTRPWRPLNIPKGVTFTVTTEKGLEKKVYLHFKGESWHWHPVTYEGNPARNMRKVQRILLSRFKASSMCHKVN